MIMSEWKEVKIGDVCSVKRGASPRPIQNFMCKNGMPWVKIADATRSNSRYINSTEEFIIEEGVLKSRTVTPGTLIVSNSATPGLPKIMGITGCVHDGWLIIDDFNGVLKEYMYYKFIDIRRVLSNQANGSVFMNLKTDIVKSFPIHVPTIEEQAKMVSFLENIDSKIECNQNICANLEAQAQALFKHWFVDFAPFKDGKFVESELGIIPEGWRVGKLGDVSSFISRGLSPKYQPGTNEMVLGQTCVRNNIVTLDNAREHNPKQNTDKRVQKWDVLLNSTGIGSLGRVGVVYFDDNNVCFDSHLTVVRSRQESFRYYLGRNLLSRQKEIENMAVGSTGQTELPKKDVLVMPILIPSDCSLTSFNVLIDDIGNEMYSLLQENRRLSSLRDTLLPKLMSGEIKL